MIGLLDGDIVVFRCGFAAERNIWHLAWDLDGDTWKQEKTFEFKKEAEEHLDKLFPGKYSREQGKDYDIWPVRDLQPLGHALQSVKTLINRVCEANALDPQFDLKIYLSDGKNFRHEIAKTREYKGNRKVEHRPAYEHDIKKYLRENYDTMVAENEEADDLMAIAQTKYGPEDSVIITLDKDLDQVPGLKYNWMHDVGYNITPEQAYYNFHIQLMSGDSTDNIPGLPKIGPAKAAKALHGLETEQEQFDEVCRMYQIHSGKEDWQEYLTEQGRLLWIQRYPGQLWTPDWTYEVDDIELTLEVD